jgi:hypothetical protein
VIGEGFDSIHEVLGSILIGNIVKKKNPFTLFFCVHIRSFLEMIAA